MGNTPERRRWPCVPNTSDVYRCDVITVPSPDGLGRVVSQVFINGKEVPKLEPKPVTTTLPRLSFADLDATTTRSKQRGLDEIFHQYS